MQGANDVGKPKDRAQVVPLEKRDTGIPLQVHDSQQELVGDQDSQLNKNIEMYQQSVEYRETELEYDDLMTMVQHMISTYKGSGQNINEEQLNQCERLGDELMKRGVYDKAGDLYSIILETDAQPKFYIKRADCYRHQFLFVEGAKDLASASQLAPNLNASISNKTFFQQMQHYYRDLDIKFW